MPGVTDKLEFPQKTDRNLGSRRDAWCEFHKAFGHNVERCIALDHQLASLVKEGFLKEYLEADQEERKGEVILRDQAHETPIYENLNTILGGFSRGGNFASKCKQYAQSLMSLEARKPDHPPEPTLCFTSSNLEDVVPHEDDPVMISVVTVGRKVHKVLIDQESSTDVMF